MMTLRKKKQRPRSGEYNFFQEIRVLLRVLTCRGVVFSRLFALCIPAMSYSRAAENHKNDQTFEHADLALVDLKSKANGARLTFPPVRVRLFSKNVFLHWNDILFSTNQSAN